jgi:hypothetical protein
MTMSFDAEMVDAQVVEKELKIERMELPVDTWLGIQRRLYKDAKEATSSRQTDRVDGLASRGRRNPNWLEEPRGRKDVIDKFQCDHVHSNFVDAYLGRVGALNQDMLVYSAKVVPSVASYRFYKGSPVQVDPPAAPGAQAPGACRWRSCSRRAM